MGGALLEGWVSFSDLAQGPIDGFFHKVSAVCRAVSDGFQEGGKVVVCGAFVVNRQGGHEHEAGASDVFGFAKAPGEGFGVGVGRAREEVDAELVAEVPRVEGADPVFHLPGGDESGVVHHGGEDSRFVDFGLPEGVCGVVLVAIVAGEFAKRGD